MSSVLATVDERLPPLTEAELAWVEELPNRGVERLGWGVTMRQRAGYHLPDAYYEAMVARLCQSGVTWLDVGCGRDLFPHNRPLAETLAARCGRVVGVDPDDTIDENEHLHERIKQPIDQFESEWMFDLVTMRMVAEHVADPRAALERIARHTRLGGKVVVYTVHRWSPAAVAARWTPFGWHHSIKRVLWRTEEKDTFPVVYRMNTRRQLAAWFAEAGFVERHFEHLDDCRTLARFRGLHRCELALWRGLQGVGLHYPETCLLGVYERREVAQTI